MLIIVLCGESKAAIVPSEVSSFAGVGDGKCEVYIKGLPNPYVVRATFEEFESMYQSAISSKHGVIANFEYAGYQHPDDDDFCTPPNPPEDPEQRAHRLGRLEKFQQDLRLMFPEAYVFVKNPDGTWLYNTATAVVTMDGGHWKSWAPDPQGLEPVGLIGWKTVDSEICDEWREELKWLHWGASMFYGQRYDHNIEITPNSLKVAP